MDSIELPKDIIDAIDMITLIFSRKTASRSVQRAFTEIENLRKTEAIKKGLILFYQNPSNYKWRSFIKELFERHEIEIEEFDTLRDLFKILGVSINGDPSNYSGYGGKNVSIEFTKNNSEIININEMINTVKQDSKSKVFFENMLPDIEENLNRILTVLTQSYIIENGLRFFLLELEKKGIEVEFSKKTQQGIEKRKKDSKLWVPPRGDHPIFWTNMNELKKIFDDIARTQKNQLEEIGVELKLITSSAELLEELTHYRNYTAHNPLFGPTDETMRILTGIWAKFQILFSQINRSISTKN